MSETPFDRCTLENGLTVIGERFPEARSVAVGYFLRTGARDETPLEHGVSHFLEHMAFKGPPGLSAPELNRRFDAIGANVNAFTGEESTVYHAATLPSLAPALLELLSGLLNPALRQEDFDLEKAVILEEIEMYDDEPTSRLFDALRARYFAGHPLGRSVLGERSSVAALTPEAMRAYHTQRYRPNNAVLAFCGNYDWSALLEHARKLTADWTPREVVRNYPAFAPRASETALEDQTLSRALCAVMFPGFAAQDPRRLPASVLAEILGGDSGRLYWSLIDPGLADEASFSHSEADGLGHFEGFVSSDPEKQDECLGRYLGELERVQREGVSEAELRRAIRKMAVATALRDDTPYPRLFSFGLEFLYTGRLQTTGALLRELNAVTLEDVEGVLAARPFDTRSSVRMGALEGVQSNASVPVL